MIKKIKNFDKSVADSVVYKAIDSVCNYLLTFCFLCIFLMALKQIIQIYMALNRG